MYSEEVFVYTDSQSIHLQIGFIDDNINSFIVFGDGFEFDHMALGMSSNEMKNNVDLENEITYEDDKNYFKLLLSEKDLEYNPLIKLSDTLFLQLYFDVENDEVVAMRFMDGLTLVKHRMYKMEYSGDVPTIIDDDNDEWDDIENDMENTILELTNIIRNVHGKSTLELNDSASKVAKNHSEDMYRHNYFSHTSLNGHSLADRLEKANTKYIMAAENIAKSHTDSVAAVLGWLNSKGHRDSLLDDEYNEIGVGVYRQYYTQVFLAN